MTNNPPGMPKPITEPQKFKEGITRRKVAKRVPWSKIFDYKAKMLAIVPGTTICWHFRSKAETRGFGQAICTAKFKINALPERKGGYRLQQKQVGSTIYVHWPAPDTGFVSVNQPDNYVPKEAMRTARPQSMSDYDDFVSSLDSAVK